MASCYCSASGPLNASRTVVGSVTPSLATMIHSRRRFGGRLILSDCHTVVSVSSAASSSLDSSIVTSLSVPPEGSFSIPNLPLSYTLRLKITHCRSQSSGRHPLVSVPYPRNTHLLTLGSSFFLSSLGMCVNAVQSKTRRCLTSGFTPVQA